MKEGLHPAYNETTITCACGNVMNVGSTRQDLKVDICSKMPSILDRKLKERQLVVEQISLRKIWTSIKY